MRPRLLFRGAIAGMLMGIGIATIGWTGSSSVMAQAATPATTILVIDGHVSGGKPAAFDLAALQAMPVTRITTMTPWTDGENLYEGVKIRDLLQQLGAKGDTILADAVDDYQVKIPIEDIQDYDVIVAYAVDGHPLPEDDKGPLWIIYPYSEHSGLQKDLYFSRSVWQLNRLTVQ
ncbi:molybdopterin-dependent oxidoreductase [Dongia sp.]|uniref:molybdopterin-dependent oxidoreductase n=1 Tax=Dongia sp. TaxID=1977262 RepID=UPI0037519D40